MKKAALLGAVVVLAMTIAAPAFATGADGAGRLFGEHHSMHAQEHGFSGTMNPGMHQGFSNWMPDHED